MVVGGARNDESGNRLFRVPRDIQKDGDETTGEIVSHAAMERGNSVNERYFHLVAVRSGIQYQIELDHKVRALHQAIE